MDLPWPQQSVFREFGPLGQSFGAKGLLEPNSKIRTFVTKPYNMGVYGLPCTLAISFWGIWIPVPNFGSKGLLEPNSKICTFVTKPYNMGVYGLT